MDSQGNNITRVSRLAVVAFVSSIVGPTFAIYDHYFLPYEEPGGLLILGILSMLAFLASPILAIVSLVRISSRKRMLHGRALAVGAILFVIIGWLLLLPLMGAVKPQGRSIICKTKLFGIGRAMRVYASDYEKKWPTAEKWCDLLIAEGDADSGDFLCCPSIEDSSDYALNKYAADLGTDMPADMVLVFESTPGWNQVGGPEILASDRHEKKGCNILFADGHVDWIAVDDIDKLKWQPSANGQQDGVQ